MLSAIQFKEKETKVLKCVKAYLEKERTIEEVSVLVEIPSSSVQRYLNEESIIINHLGKDVYDFIQSELISRKNKGVSKGGKVSTARNIGIRDNNGKFIGNIKRFN